MPARTRTPVPATDTGLRLRHATVAQGGDRHHLTDAQVMTHDIIMDEAAMVLVYNEPTLPNTERLWRLHDPLSEAEMDAVATSYYGGVSVAQLTGQYASTTGVSTSSSDSGATGSARTARARRYRKHGHDTP